MTARQHRAAGIERPPTTGQPLDVLAPDEPEWLWESLRYQFWQPTDLARSFRGAGQFEPEQREAIAYGWSLVAAVEGLGPRAYAAAFVRATERHDSDQVRWSLLAMLRDELKHEQLCRLAIQGLAPGWPLHYQPQTTLGRHASRHLDQVDQQAERCWHGYQRALGQDGIGVVSGALLLSTLVTGSLCERWAFGCAIPVFATAFRHIARDAQRHQGVLRTLAARDWPLLSDSRRSDAAAHVQAAAKLLSIVMLDPATGRPDLPGGPAADQPAWQAALGVPTAEQRQELLRTALLQVKDLQHRYHVPFPAVPELAILGTQQAAKAASLGQSGGTQGPPGDRPWSLHPSASAGAR
jgi:hypothetical protein